jgi:hypothetical protein
MQDLFTCDLDDVTTDDVLAFLRWDEPGERQAEGVRVDFKRGDETEKVGDVACAFANTFGGLLFVGVVEKGGRPTAFGGVAKTRSDLKTRLANMIQGTVHPRPSFSIQVLGVPNDPEREIAVVRVGEGDWPPYIFKNHKVSVRIEDKCEHASYADLERLFRQRENVAAGDFSTRLLPGPELRASTLGENNERVDSDLFARVWIRPARPLRLTLDRRKESAICKSLAGVFPMGIGVTRRDSTSFDVKIGDGWPQLAWRACDDGTQVVAANIATLNHPNGMEVYLSVVVDRWLRTFRAASTILEEHGALGSVGIRSDLVVGKRPVSAAPIERGFRLDGLDGLHVVQQRESFTIDLVANHSELANPATLVAELLVRNLRELRGLDVDLQAIMKSVAAASERLTTT